MNHELLLLLSILVLFITPFHYSKLKIYVVIITVIYTILTCTNFQGSYTGQCAHSLFGKLSHIFLPLNLLDHIFS